MVITLAFYLEIYAKQGETFYREFQLFDDEAGTEPTKIGGWTGECDIRNTAPNQGVILSPSVIIIDADNGIYALSATAAQMATIPTSLDKVSDYERFECDVRFNTGSTIEFSTEGPIFINAGVTR